MTKCPNLSNAGSGKAPPFTSGGCFGVVIAVAVYLIQAVITPQPGA